MSNLLDHANTLLTEGGPTISDGSSDGPAQAPIQPKPARDGPTQPEAGSQAEPEVSSQTEPKVVPAESSGLPPAVHAHLTGIPETLALHWAPNCKADVLPKGKGYCPRCARMLKGSFLARRHPVNVLRKQQLLNKLTAEYQPRTTMQQATCAHLAGILEQLEVLKPGSPEHQRLVQLSQSLGAALEGSRSSQHVPDADYDAMTDDELIDRLEQTLQAARASRDLKREHQPRLDADVVGAAVAEDGVTLLEPGDEGHAPQEATRAATVRQPTVEICKHCRKSPDRCIQIKPARLAAR